MSSFDLAAYACETYAAFPAARERVFFIDAAAAKVIHPDAELAALAQGIVDEGVFHTATFIQECAQAAAGRTGCCLFQNQERFVLHYTGDDISYLLARHILLAAQHEFILDHELAHALSREVIEVGGALSESVSDVYACLRHVQRGGNAQVFTSLMLRRAMGVVLRDDENFDPVHFTCPAVDAALKLSQEKDITLLSPQETLTLAQRLALQHTPQDLLAMKIHEAFAETGRMMRNAQDDAPLRHLASRLMETEDPAAFRWGGEVLRGILDGDVVYKLRGAPVDLVTPEWQGFKAGFNARAARFAAEGLAFGLNSTKDNVIPFKREANPGRPSSTPRLAASTGP